MKLFLKYSEVVLNVIDKTILVFLFITTSEYFRQSFNTQLLQVDIDRFKTVCYMFKSLYKEIES